MAGKLKLLNVGGGSKEAPIPDYYAGFEHVLLDIDPEGKPDIVCDARELAGRKAGEFDAIYCSHNLEHYHPHDVPKVLAGFLHVLKPGGFAEIRVPDIDAVIRAYVERKMDIEDVLYRSGAGPVRVHDVIYGYAPRIAQSGQDYYAHRSCFTAKSLSRALNAAGFPVLVHRTGRPLELLVVAFRKPPTAAQTKLLELNLPKRA